VYSLLADVKTEATEATYPLTFEALGQSHGFVLYETTVKDLFRDPAKLSVKGISDRGYVFVDGQGPVGILDRQTNILEMPISISPGQKLQIYVENAGRICFGPDINDFKGITTNVTLNNVMLKNWSMQPQQLDQRIPMLEEKWQTKTDFNNQDLINVMQKSGGALSYWQGEFNGCVDGAPRDTYLDMTGWKKGYAFVNGFNLGRYWPAAGPQVTLFVPGPALHEDCSAANSIVIFENEQPPCLKQSGSMCEVNFVTEPNLTGPNPIA